MVSALPCQGRDVSSNLTICSKFLRKQTAILVLNINLLNWHSLTLFSVFILIIKLNFKYEKFFEMFMYGNAFKRYFFYG